MREMYVLKRLEAYRLPGPGAVGVPDRELRAIVSELSPIVAPYASRETGAIGNGLYRLMGNQASPRLPSVEDYAKVLVLAATRLGPERAVGLFAEWVEGRPIRVWEYALLKGVTTEGALRPVEGLCLDTLPSNSGEFPRSLALQIEPHDIRYEQFANRGVLSIEHETGPALYSPDGEAAGGFVFPPPPEIRNPDLSSLSLDGLCRVISVEANSNVDWFRGWWDYGDADAFFLNPGSSHSSREVRDTSSSLISEEQLARSLELHKLLDGFTQLDLGIARWRRSKQAPTTEEQLVELRIAMESVLLADDQGVVGEKRLRLAIRGAWLLGETFEQRKSYFDSLYAAYGNASKVIHAGSLKKKDQESKNRNLAEAQDNCRAAIMRIAKAKAMPNRTEWADLVLGGGLDCVPGSVPD
ncbi:MAG: hypothetical protein F4Y28_09240 [Acidimicrobiia bacterium]|nr:hypothetical protein [Acidimicrobiia bacterium]MYJ31174.1 hypothetical protein [Acidimicrobiia bacterium]